MASFALKGLSGCAMNVSKIRRNNRWGDSITAVPSTARQRRGRRHNVPTLEYKVGSCQRMLLNGNVGDRAQPHPFASTDARSTASALRPGVRGRFQQLALPRLFLPQRIRWIPTQVAERESHLQALARTPVRGRDFP